MVYQLCMASVRYMSYSKCSNWRQISKLGWNFVSLFTVCYSAWINLLKTKLQTCNLQTGQSISYKYVNQFWLNVPHPNSQKVNKRPKFKKQFRYLRYQLEHFEYDMNRTWVSKVNATNSESKSYLGTLSG